MKCIKYSLIMFFISLKILVNAQKIEQNFTKEITVKKNVKLTLEAEYADIKIIEWNKNKIKVNATLKVEDTNKIKTKNYLNSWKINLIDNDNEVKLVSKLNFTGKNKAINKLLEYDYEMPEISLESLGVLDSMKFSFPEMNFSKVFKDTIFNKIYKYDFNYSFYDSTFIIDVEKLKKNQEYLQKWQKKNKENFTKLRLEAKKINELQNKIKQEKNIKREDQLLKIQELRSKIRKKREIEMRKRKIKQKQLLEKINKTKRKRMEMRKALQNKKQKEIKKRKNIRNRIREIIKNRKKPKVRTKITVYVPKGTKFTMNVNYCTVTTN